MTLTDEDAYLKVVYVVWDVENTPDVKWFDVKLISKDVPVDILLNTGWYLVVLGP